MTLLDASSVARSTDDPLIGSFAPSTAGPGGRHAAGRPARHPAARADPARTVRAAPAPFLFRARRELGEVFTFDVPIENRELVITSHPDHAKSLFTAKQELVPSMTAESPLRPIMGEGVLTTNGDRHMRQRKLLLPPFHGEAIKQYEAMIEATIHRELDRWKEGDTFRLSERMQAVTLDVIMAGIFGVEGEPPEGSTERRLRDMTRRALSMSEKPWFARSSSATSAGPSRWGC